MAIVPVLGSHPAAIANARVERKETGTATTMTAAARVRHHGLQSALGIEGLRPFGAGRTFRLGGGRAAGRRCNVLGTCDSRPLGAALLGACALADIVVIELVAVLADDL